MLGESDLIFFYLTEISENSIDVRIPSFPGSPRSLDAVYLTSSPIDTKNSKGKESNAENEIDKSLCEAFNRLQLMQEDNIYLEKAALGDSQAIEEFLGDLKTNIHQKDHMGRNALHLATCSGDERTITLLLKAGVNPNVKDKVGMTPLSLCLLRCPSVRVVELLFDHGAKFLARTGVMDTGLFMQYTMMCGPDEEDEKILRLLTQKGCAVDDPLAPGGRQPLHFAAMSNNCKLVEILFDLGADLYATNARGETPREVALFFKCKEVSSLLENMEELYGPYIESAVNSSTSLSETTITGDIRFRIE